MAEPNPSQQIYGGSNRNLFSRLTVGNTFSRAFSIFSAHKQVFLLISLLSMVPMFFLVYTMNSIVNESLQDFLATVDDSATAYQDPMEAQMAMYTSIGAHAKSSIWKLIVENIVYMLMGVFVQAAMSFAVAKAYVLENDHSSNNPDAPSVKECLQKAYSRFCTVFCSGFLVGMYMGIVYGVTVGIAALCFSSKSVFLKLLATLIISAFVIIATYVTVAMMLVAPVVMVEGKGVTNGIRRCWELASGNRCYIYCTVFVFSVIQMLAHHVAIAIFGSSLLVSHTFFNSLIGVGIATVITPLMTIITTVVYFNIRVQREGLNREVLMREIGSRAEISYAPLEEDPEKVSEEPLI